MARARRTAAGGSDGLSGEAVGDGLRSGGGGAARPERTLRGFALVIVSVRSCALLGIEALPVTVEVEIAAGHLPAYHVVGLPATSIREGAVRIRAALEHVGRALPRRKIT